MQMKSRCGPAHGFPDRRSAVCSDRKDSMLSQVSPRRSMFAGILVLALTVITLASPIVAGERHARRNRIYVVCPPADPVPPATSPSQQCGVAVAAPAAEVVPQPASPEIVLLGYSVKGVPITAHVFGTAGRPALIFGAIHGSEPNSGSLARDLLDFLSAHPEACSGRRVAVIPVANPDGLVRNRRLNEHNVDLNRNFPARNWAASKPGSNYGGDKPAAEPETQAIIKAVELLQPDRIVSIHAITNGRECNNYDGPGAELAAAMKSHNGYRVAKTIGYPTPGSFGSWAGIDRQIATITLELPVNLPGNQCWAQHKDALLAVIQFKPKPE